jgi:hypothetical protein
MMVTKSKPSPEARTLTHEEKAMTPEGKAAIRAIIAPYIIQCGRHSGFPECCVQHYVQQYIVSRSYLEGYHAKMNERGVSFGYVPCPECLEKGQPIVVLDCSCHKDVWPEYQKKIDAVMAGLK